MYCGRDFSERNPGESAPLTFDFVNDLDDGETLTSATWSLSVVSGTDADPSSHLIGSAIASGTQTIQRVSGLLAGVKYVVKATVVTNQSNTLILYSHVRCVEPS